jgi:hypothetical protein
VSEETFDEQLERAERYASDRRERICVFELLAAEARVDSDAARLDQLLDSAAGIMQLLTDPQQQGRVVDLLARHGVSALIPDTPAWTEPEPSTAAQPIAAPARSAHQDTVEAELARAAKLAGEGRERLALRALTEAAAAAGTHSDLRELVRRAALEIRPQLTDSTQSARLDQLDAQLESGELVASLAAPGVLPTSPSSATSPRVGGWGVAIFFFGILGGFIGWLDLKEKDRRRADHILKWGAIMSAASIGLTMLLWLLIVVIISSSA